MFAKRTLGILFTLAFVGLPAVSEGALARRLGSRYGGTLSSNPAIRAQQLAADPESVFRGSTSTEYDPSVVKLNSITPGSGFFISEAYVGVSFDGGDTEDLVSLSQFQGGLESSFIETGYLQVFYQAESEGSSESLALEEDGYTVVDTDGEIAGDNTHNMLFDYIAEIPTTVARYRLYRDDGSRGTSEDSLRSMEEPDFKITDIAEANVAGADPAPHCCGPGPDRSCCSRAGQAASQAPGRLSRRDASQPVSLSN